MEVELDAFSGRKNPEWTLTPDVAASVNAALSSALPEAPALAIPGHLGYRGFIIRSAGREARVYRGRIVVTDRGNTQTFFDSARIEALLAAEARRRGFAEVVQNVDP